MAFKFTMIFNQGRNGWSESFYLDTADGDDARKKIAVIRQSRQTLMGDGCTMDGVRMSNPAIRGSTLLLAAPPVNQADLDFAQDPRTAAVFSLRFGPGPGGGSDILYRRNYLLRGFSAGMIDGNQDGGQKINSGWVGTVKGYFDTLKTFGASALVNSKLTSPAVITLADKNAGPKLTTKEPHGLAVGDDVLLSGFVHGWKKANGRTKVLTVVDGTNFIADVEGVQGGVFFPPAFVQQLTPGYAPLKEWTFLRTVAKDTGKAFFVSRGRYSSRPLTS